MQSDPLECRRMWCAVLIQVLKDLAHANMRDAHIRLEAERWIGPYPSKRFKLTCTNAGLDPDCAYAFFRTLCDTPHKDRKHLVGELLRKETGTSRARAA